MVTEHVTLHSCRQTVNVILQFGFLTFSHDDAPCVAEFRDQGSPGTRN